MNSFSKGVQVPDRFTGDGIVEKVSIVSATAGAGKHGECLAQAVTRDLEALTKLRGEIEEPLRALFVLSFIGNRAQVAGRNTAADGIIKLAGAVNAIAEFEGYKAVNDEAMFCGIDRRDARVMPLVVER